MDFQHFMDLNKSLWFSDSGKFNGAFRIAEHDYFLTDCMLQFDDLEKKSFLSPATYEDSSYGEISERNN